MLLLLDMALYLVASYSSSLYYSFHTATLVNPSFSIFNNYKKKKRNLLWSNIFPDISRMFVLACILRVILIALDIQTPVAENMYSNITHSLNAVKNKFSLHCQGLFYIHFHPVVPCQMGNTNYNSRPTFNLVNLFLCTHYLG